MGAQVLRIPLRSSQVLDYSKPVPEKRVSSVGHPMTRNAPVLTAEDLYTIPENGFRYELVRGVLRTMAFHDAEHGVVSLNIGCHLMFYARQHELGSTYAAGTGFHISSNPDSVLSPDVAFVAQDRVKTIIDRRKFVPFAPDLAVEVLSPEDNQNQAERRADDWLSAGSRAVTIVDPSNETVRIYLSSKKSVILNELDILEVPDIVPGWSISVAEIFMSD